jgi:GTP-binding protein
VIKGASQGSGLGSKFLKHVAHTGVLLHIIDVLPIDGSLPSENFAAIESELKAYDQSIYHKPRWLVLNKIDLLEENQKQKHCQSIVSAISWPHPVYQISTVTKEGIQVLLKDLSRYINEA